MRIANLAGRLVLLDGELAVDVETASNGSFDAEPQPVYSRWAEFTEWAASADLPRGSPYDALTLGSPAPLAAAGVCHRLEFRRARGRDRLPDAGPEPPVFTKFASCITGPYCDVAVPPGGHIDWEVELVVAKSFPNFGPVGPCLVTVDEFDDPDDLELGCLINGETMQKGRTSEMIFSVPQLIAKLSAVLPLQPGDVIFTGTPAGVGLGRETARWLQAGDELLSYVRGIGELRQRFVATAD